MQSSNEKVNEFLIDIQSTFPSKYETVEKIRKIFFSENSEVDEEIKYGGIAFNISGQLIGGIYVYKQHISIEFSYGAQFTDSDGFLEGTGKLRRHLKILDINDVKNKKIDIYINQSVND
ncbi:MAG: DUF1801 domain-containing protein [Sulfurovaceae bacterium]|nr:DUF1801 domain-containing protein [Sulfurovaceae bacterium]